MSESITDKEAIRQILKQNRGSSKKVAVLVGVLPSALSMWLHGRSPSSRLDTEVPKAVKALKLKARRAA